MTCYVAERCPRLRKGLIFTMLAAVAPPVWASGLADTIGTVKASVVGVGTFQPTRAPAAQLRGTGFALVDGSHVLTNAHVVSETLNIERNEQYIVFAGSGSDQDVRNAEKVALDRTHDLALLKISGKPLPPLRLGDSDRVREGGQYAFTGFPIGTVLGLYPVTHTGTVSAITPIATPLDRSGQLNGKLIRHLQSPFDIFQLDATAYPGNSGSPLYDPDTGAVMGVVNMVYVKQSKESVLQDPSGISYAIPINYVRDLLRDAGLKAGDVPDQSLHRK